MAWIGKQADLGKMLVAFDTGETTEAAWTVSDLDWSGASPSWQPPRRWDNVVAPWPPPENHANIYDPMQGFSFLRYERPHAVWSGQDDVAVIVATGVTQGPLQGHKDVVALASTDCGQTFTSAQILSVPWQIGQTDYQSGEAVDADTVYVALPRTIEQLTTDMGGLSVPIYAVWRNVHETSQWFRGWYMTQFVVSVDFNAYGPGNEGLASIAQLALPRKISPNPIPDEMFGLVAIDGHDRAQGGEGVMLHWSERAQSLPTDCTNTSQTIAVTWKSALTEDWGKTWASLGTIDSDPDWRPCITDGSATSGHNNDRPVPVTQQRVDGVTSVLAPPACYVAINKNVDGSQKIVLQKSAGYVSGSWQPWGQIFQSEGEGDAWGQSTALHVGKYLTPPPDPDLSIVHALIWRWNDGGDVWTMGSTHAGAEVPLSTTSTGMSYSDRSATYTGVAFLQTCLYDVGSGCTAAASYPDIPALGVWVESDTSSTRIVARKFTH